MPGVGGGLRHHHGDGVILVVAHAEGQRLDALMHGQRGHLAVKNDIAPTRRVVPPHLDRAPVSRRSLGPERLQGRLLGREAHGEARGGHPSGAGSTVRSFRAP